MMGNTYVDDIANAVLLFSNPVWSGDSSIPSTVVKNITALSSDIAYSSDIDSNITILTSRYATTQSGTIQGLLYVPDLPDDHPCKELEAQHVPPTAVRQADLPPSDYNLIALVPWYNATCTKLYMDAAASDPLRGFITYLTTADSNKPPEVDDKAWSLYDHGAWKSSIKFPVYAISGNAGRSMMTPLGLYSGNVSSVPYGANISALYGSSEDDYVRIWTEIHVNTPSSLPTIWIFILACIGVLFAFLGLVSFSMHYVQRRRRTSLERRVASGEVNLEAMNIKRVRVPIEYVEKFPLFTYNYEPTHNSLPPSPISPRMARIRDDKFSVDEMQPGALNYTASEKALASPRSTVTGITNASTATDYQPKCTICLEDYENRSTIIRELPCGHIYHPDCIDEFLCEISCLCPQCKASMLPTGYCPPITNAMVRRERAVRRLRGQVVLEEGELQEGSNKWKSNLKKKMYRPSNNAPHPVQEPPGRHSPTSEARMRMRTLAGADTISDVDSSDGQPQWKKVTRTVFPGFR
ncbi:hypothetical protein N0V93_001521 [Gnomoniopsis smithogilvyi]|uniref:RING-type domain-containing protein n=1 Tax=Gnomoniopsis smithogilvyi TaxID=1191159 RepID=A0A9W8Z1T5_9PEZI|nr:hypothetical protein N0V93_001521 [Gnomoniopsis smithogilvyi]